MRQCFLCWKEPYIVTKLAHLALQYKGYYVGLSLQRSRFNSGQSRLKYISTSDFSVATRSVQYNFYADKKGNRSADLQILKLRWVAASKEEIGTTVIDERICQYTPTIRTRNWRASVQYNGQYVCPPSRGYGFDSRYGLYRQNRIWQFLMAETM